MRDNHVLGVCTKCGQSHLGQKCHAAKMTREDAARYASFDVDNALSPREPEEEPDGQRQPTCTGLRVMSTISSAATIGGTYSRIYVDREHVKAEGANARPWVVENERGKFRCREIRYLGEANTAFNLSQKPALWLETTQVVAMYDVEILT
jgi:hypothetical protein